MEFISRSTLGVIIGILNVLGYFAAVIFIIIFMVKMNEEFDHPIFERDSIGLYLFNWIFVIYIIICLIMMCTSVLLIIGIIKKRHKMMIPWLLLSAIGYVIQTIRFAYNLVSALEYEVSAGSVFSYILYSLLGFGISGLIIWLIYTLFKDIEKQNIEKPTQIKYQIQTN